VRRPQRTLLHRLPDNAGPAAVRRFVPQDRSSEARASSNRRGTGNKVARRTEKVQSDFRIRGNGGKDGTQTSSLCCSAITASSVKRAAVTPMRSKHSATILLDAVSRLMSKSIGVR